MQRFRVLFRALYRIDVPVRKVQMIEWTVVYSNLKIAAAMDHFVALCGQAGVAFGENTLHSNEEAALKLDNTVVGGWVKLMAAVADGRHGAR